MEMTKFKLIVLSFLFVLILSTTGLCQNAASDKLASRELLTAGKLTCVWETKLPIKPGETLDQLFIIKDRLYAFSSKNYCVSTDTLTGKAVFSRPLAKAGLPILGFDAFEDQLYSVVGNRLVEMNLQTGLEITGIRLDFSLTCPAARNESFFYVADTSHRLRTLRAANKVKIFEASAENESAITSIIAERRFVVFSTNAGNVISISPDKPKRFWEFNAGGGVVGPMIRDGEHLFFASDDTNVYKVNILNGTLAWKYPAGAILKSRPRVTKTVVYQNLGEKGLVAIDKKSGHALWQVNDGVELLAESGNKAYIITKNATLVVMDNKNRGQLYASDFGGVTKYAANVSDQMIYVADDTGRLACLKPAE